MKKLSFLKLFVACVVAGTVFSLNLAAWNGRGHQAIVALAQRHLTPTAAANIAKYMDYDLKQDASWMDHHRQDKEYHYASKWHSFHVYPETHLYNPTTRVGHGDAIYAIEYAWYNLSHYEQLTPEEVVLNLRFVLHCVGDMHCPVHCVYTGLKVPVVKEYHGKETKGFHTIYDSMPSRLFAGKQPDQIAEILDTLTDEEMQAIASGTPKDWAKECGDRCEVIYQINPRNGDTPIQMDPDTDEKSRALVEYQLRAAGYRMARLLNECFDPDFLLTSWR